MSFSSPSLPRPTPSVIRVIAVTAVVQLLLETIFTEREQGRDGMEGVLDRAGEHARGASREDFGELESLGLVRRDERCKQSAAAREPARRAHDGPAP